LGGSNWNTPSDRVKVTDLNDTFDMAGNIKGIIMNLESINQNTILSQEAGITDKSYTYASSDNFSDSNGYNNTIDTGESDKFYYLTNGAYIGSISDEAGGDTTHDPNGATDVNNAFDGDDETYASLSGYPNYSIGKTFSSKLVRWVRIKCTGYANQQSGAVVSVTATLKLQKYNGADWSDVVTLDTVTGDVKSNVSYNGIYYLNETTQGLRIQETASCTEPGGGYLHLHTLEYGNEFTDAVVQTNSKTFSSNVNSILVNANKALNGNSTITVDVSSDGGSTWDVTEQNLDEVISLDGDGTDIVVKFNLNVDSEDTPELYGYSYQVWTEEES